MGGLVSSRLLFGQGETRSGISIEQYLTMRMTLKDRGWNMGVDRAMQDFFHDFSFGGPLGHQ